MKINERDALNIPKSQPERLYQTSKTETRSSQKDRTSASGNDQIELGSSGLLSQAVSAGSDARAARVQQLRALVQSGQYRVDTAALSQAIVGSTLRGY